MKIKDLFSLGFLAVVLIILGSFFVGKIGRGDQPRSAEIEIVQPISSEFNEDARNILQGQSQQYKATKYSAPADLRGGFGNTRPFGP